MADAAKIKITATILPDEIQKKLTGLEVIVNQLLLMKSGFMDWLMLLIVVLI